MRATMTALPIVPSKFYQVCRLCLAVVNDTSDLINLSVFGRHDTACMDKAAAASAQQHQQQQQPSGGDNACVPVPTSTQSSGVIVKANAQCVNSTSRKSSINNDSGSAAEREDDDQQSSGATSDNEAASADDAATDDEQTILNNNNNLQQSEILERIYTFLSITVSQMFLIFRICSIKNRENSFFVSVADTRFPWSFPLAPLLDWR